MYVYIYIYMCVYICVICVCVCLYIYIYIYILEINFYLVLSDESNFYEKKKQGSSKQAGAIFLDSDIRKQSMSKKDHFNATFQLTSSENVKAM